MFLDIKRADEEFHLSKMEKAGYIQNFNNMGFAVPDCETIVKVIDVIYHWFDVSKEKAYEMAEYAANNQLTLTQTISDKLNVDFDEVIEFSDTVLEEMFIYLKVKTGEYRKEFSEMVNGMLLSDEYVSKNAVNIINDLKMSDEKYIQYLEMKTEKISPKDMFSIDKVILELVRWNKDFMKTEIFRDKKSDDITKITEDFCEGRLPQIGDNLTIMDNPIALLLAAVGDDPLKEGCFKLREDGVECYTPRFKDGESLAAF